MKVDFSIEVALWDTVLKVPCSSPGSDQICKTFELQFFLVSPSIPPLFLLPFLSPPPSPPFCFFLSLSFSPLLLHSFPPLSLSSSSYLHLFSSSLLPSPSILPSPSLLFSFPLSICLSSSLSLSF